MLPGDWTGLSKGFFGTNVKFFVLASFPMAKAANSLNCLDELTPLVKMRRNRSVMALRKCDKCGGELSDSSQACPACGTLVPTAVQTPAANAKSGTRKTSVKILGILAVCLLLGLVIVAFIAPRKGTVAIPEVAEIVNPDEIRTKAERGEAEAQKKLGTIYATGQSVKQDYQEAARWYRQAADQGHAGAQTALGELYEAGQGVPRDDAEAAKWYRRAAEQGHAPAQYSLAILYVMGKGVPHDNAEALKWYRQAADQGDALAQYNLGMRYYEGNAVPPDPVEAYKWLSLAAARGMPDATKARDDVKRTMTREQIAEGRRRTDAFVAKTAATRTQ